MTAPTDAQLREWRARVARAQKLYEADELWDIIDVGSSGTATSIGHDGVGFVETALDAMPALLDHVEAQAELLERIRRIHESPAEDTADTLDAIGAVLMVTP